MNGWLLLFTQQTPRIRFSGCYPCRETAEGLSCWWHVDQFPRCPVWIQVLEKIPGGNWIHLSSPGRDTWGTAGGPENCIWCTYLPRLEMWTTEHVPQTLSCCRILMPLCSLLQGGLSQDFCFSDVIYFTASATSTSCEGAFHKEKGAELKAFLQVKR